MGITSTDSITATESTVLPGCVETSTNLHPKSPLTVRKDADGTGLDLNLYGGTDPVTAPTCNCTRDAVRSGAHLVEGADGVISSYVEPAPRTFDYRSDAININGNQTAPTGTNQQRDFVTGPVTLTVRSGCYPQTVNVCFSVCAFHAVIPPTADGEDRARFWIGEMKWQANINNVPYNTETQALTEEHEDNYCEVHGNGGNMYRCIRPFTLPKESSAGFSMRFYVRNVGPLGVESYPLRISDAFISATGTEITSLAAASNPADFC